MNTKFILSLFLALFLFLPLSISAQSAELHNAVGKGDLGKVRQLLEQGADVNGRDKYQQTPLHMVHNKEMAALLIEKGADIHARNRWQATPLHKAANCEIAALLISRGADINARADYQQTPLHHAAAEGMTNVAELLISKGADVNVRGLNNETPLHLAASRDWPPVMLLLIQKGADIHARDQWQKTPLHDAARDGKTEAAALLIDKGADVNALDNANNTPLHWTSLRGNTEMAGLLINKGADVNKKNNEGETALMKVVASFDKTNVSSITLLIEHGADVNAVNNKDETALIVAAERGNTEMVKVLLEKGSTVSPKDKEGKSAWMYAAEGGNGAVMNLLEKAGAVRDDKSIMTLCADKAVTGLSLPASPEIMGITGGCFTCAFPTDWKREDNEKWERDKIYMVVFLGPRTENAPVMIHIEYFAPGNNTFKDYTDFVTRNTWDSWEDKPIAQAEKITINDNKALWFEREVKTFLHPESKSDESVMIKEKFYVFLDKNRQGFFVLHYSSPGSVYDRHLPIFERMANSFKLL